MRHNESDQELAKKYMMGLGGDETANNHHTEVPLDPPQKLLKELEELKAKHGGGYRISLSVDKKIGEGKSNRGHPINWTQDVTHESMSMDELLSLYTSGSNRLKSVIAYSIKK